VDQVLVHGVTLPPGVRLDPAISEHRPEIGVFWVILPDGTRAALNLREGNVICVVCRGDKALMPDCSECVGRGHLDRVPYCARPWDEVISNLWLGGHDCQPAGAPPQGDCIPVDEFDLVVSLYSRPGFGPSEGVRHIRYRMADSDLDPEHHTRLDEMAEHVAGALRNGERVLVRCQAGINRSSLVCGLAMLRLGWGAEEAIERMRKVRSPYVLFNQSFVDYLRSEARDFTQSSDTTREDSA